MKLCSLIVLLGWTANAATYYVATNGNNTADGSIATPWSNIWYAAKTAIAGDTVIVKEGEYNEFITNTTSGSSGNPITFTGTRSAGGDWLTIVDPSTSISNGWAAASEIGAGVYKLTNSFDPSEITIDHKRVAFVNTNGLLPGVESAYISGPTNGTQFLLLDSAGIVTNGYGYPTVFWDSVKALYGVVSNSSTAYTIYMRLRDGSDPTGLNIRVAPNRYNYHAPSMVRPAFHLNSKSFINVKNFKIRGAFGGTYLTAGHNNIIESNYMAGGWYRIFLANGTYSNVVQFNSLTTDYYGFDDPGAWGGSNTLYINRANIYAVAKFLMSPNSSSFDGCVEVESSGGSNNIISGNNMFKGIGTGVAVGNADPAILNTEVSSNTIQGMTSVGVHLPYGQTGTKVYDNLISDCNLNLRYHTMNRPGETNRIVYVYRNRCWLPQGISSHIYFNFYTGLACSYWPEYWTYHNSFSGGMSVIDVGIAIADYGIQDLRGCRFLNNVVSGPTQQFSDISSQPAYASFWTNSTSFGAFDYSEYTLPVTFLFNGPPGWQGSHMVTNSVAEWSLGSVPNFILQAGSPAINSALDVTQTFRINGTNYSALPADATVKVGPAWDMGALEAGYTGNMGTIRVGTLRGP